MVIGASAILLSKKLFSISANLDFLKALQTVLYSDPDNFLMYTPSLSTLEYPLYTAILFLYIVNLYDGQTPKQADLYISISIKFDSGMKSSCPLTIKVPIISSALKNIILFISLFLLL